MPQWWWAYKKVVDDLEREKADQEVLGPVQVYAAADDMEELRGHVGKMDVTRLIIISPKHF